MLVPFCARKVYHKSSRLCYTLRTTGFLRKLPAGARSKTLQERAMKTPGQTRGFFPTEIIFAPTSECNLKCPHCRVSRGEPRLKADDACRFLRSCRGSAIERVGFSGGEPFLSMDFLEQVCKAVVESGLLFGRLMTNGCWWESETQLRGKLGRLAEAGFDGKIGLSCDSYHGQDAEKTAAFCRSVFSVWNDGSMIEIQSVVDASRSGGDANFLAALAEGLGCGISRRTKGKGGTGTILLEGGGIFLPVHRTPRSFPGGEPDGWRARRWFREDFCVGPGNVLYVHPDGGIAPCCGFANENAALRIGRIEQTFGQVMRSARENPMVRACYVRGLSECRRQAAKNGFRFPGKTGDNCTFCDFACATADERLRSALFLPGRGAR